ncbi:serine/threonine kinase [Leifsonia xyli subsp. xyli str. CTCB07]|uniref:non-specific serine/threonine protein kinase n=1 Tax=Leifsonia xyli subsp. xyli (strain CTCB07) TaxID=281090 RepID=Q6ADB5_LEIXX|nr:serine/threonine-protein kinase [Leifsonia xyli]AAT89629.1 serine/threonine kinase [Leifsonia xyli subsp. xyli str. CTCB07]
MVQPRPGDALGAGYRLVQHVGAGAAGDVWLAETTADGPRFAAKILKPEHAKDPTLVERFIRERSVLIGLRHPGIVAVRDLVVEGETLAIVMDHIHGGSMRDALGESKTLPAADALTLTAEVFDALAAAHEHGVAHRYIKPDNVLLTEPWQPGARNVVRVTDFGIASVVDERTRQTTGLLGTPLYMSPELISRGRSTGASDVYSAGILLYELLAGRTPFAGAGTDFTIAYRHVSALPPRLAVPDDLWALLNTLLAKDPEARPSASEAARTARRLATAHSALPALEPAGDDAARRAAATRRTGHGHSVPLSDERPDLGEAGQRTIVRPLARSLVPSAPTAEAGESPAPQRGRRPEWLTKRTMALGAAGIVLLIGLGASVVLLSPGDRRRRSPSPPIRR